MPFRKQQNSLVRDRYINNTLFFQILCYNIIQVLLGEITINVSIEFIFLILMKASFYSTCLERVLFKLSTKDALRAGKRKYLSSSSQPMI